jgi:hypothetical protein
MSLLSKSEIQFLKGQKRVSKSYEYKLKSTLERKLSNLLDKDLPLLSSLFPNLLGLTEFSKKHDFDFISGNLTKNSKTLVDYNIQNNPLDGYKYENISTNRGNLHLTKPKSGEIDGEIPKYYINNPPNLMKSQSSGGVEAATTYSKQNSSHTVRLSISPSQGCFSREISHETTIRGSNSTDSGFVDGPVWATEKKYNTDLIKSIIEHPDYWVLFRKYLQGFNGPKTISSRLSYAKRYYCLLTNGNFNNLHGLTKDIRNHVMKALAALSKYLGIYDKWKGIVERYSLKWSSGFNGLDAFKKIISSDKDLESLIKAVTNTIGNKVIPIGNRNLIIYTLITGLRAAESIESVKLLKDESLRSRYLSAEQPVMKHYEFPDIFIRSTKKAYISIVNKEIIELAMSCSNVNVNNFRSFFTKRKIPLNMNYCRKIYATYLRSRGIESEIVDLLQGRIPQSVFLRH